MFAEIMNCGLVGNLSVIKSDWCMTSLIACSMHCLNPSFHSHPYLSLQEFVHIYVFMHPLGKTCILYVYLQRK